MDGRGGESPAEGWAWEVMSGMPFDVLHVLRRKANAFWLLSPALLCAFSCSAFYVVFSHVFSIFFC
jgi:hypothetical protein